MRKNSRATLSKRPYVVPWRRLTRKLTVWVVSDKISSAEYRENNGKEEKSYMGRSNGARIFGKALTGAVALTVFLVAPYRPGRQKTQPFKGRNFAHRGLHTKDKKIPENSIAAFNAAADAGYGIELDVQLSGDGRVVVFHDATLNRVCGVDSRVDEKSYAELQEIPLEGSNQTIPLFLDVLKCIGGRVPLIVELKTGKHNRELCRKTQDILSSYSGPVCVESFDPRIVCWFRIHAPQYMRGQLSCPKEDYKPQYPDSVSFILSNCLLNFLGRPNFISYKIGPKGFFVRLAELLGAVRVCWTSHAAGVNERKNDMVIFEYYHPPLSFR
jgi:glycerophosphoryl diester phosphodiesterase